MAKAKAKKEMTSKERITKLEEHVWKGIQEGINATGNKATIPELLDVLNRYSYQFNKRNLDFQNQPNQEVGKMAKA